MPKIEKKKEKVRHDPLATDIMDDNEKRNRVRAIPRNKQRIDENEPGDQSLPSKLTKKVLDTAKEMQEEDEDTLLNLDMTGATDMIYEELEEDEIADGEGFLDVTVTAEEEEAFNMFLQKKSTTEAPKSGGFTLNLADLISKKIQEHEEAKSLAGGMGQSDAGSVAQGGISEKVVDVYTKIGKWLSHYKSGKLPKAFKVIPSLRNWEEVLFLTSPLEWSPGATREATKIFASNLNPKMAQRFYNLILLPAVRANIGKYKKLNFHYYEALKKAFFKPAAFFKGVLLPLADDNCTLLEATILCSILGKISIPVLHASAALVRLSTLQPWCGTTSMFITTLLNKKYSLPYSVVGIMVQHFSGFETDQRQLPVVWHKSMLTLVQRYKHDITPKQREKLKQLLRIHFHENGIGAEIRRELFSVVVHNAMDTS